MRGARKSSSALETLYKASKVPQSKDRESHKQGSSQGPIGKHEDRRTTYRTAWHGEKCPNRGLIRALRGRGSRQRPGCGVGHKWPECEDNPGTVLTECLWKPDQGVDSRGLTMVACAEGEQEEAFQRSLTSRAHTAQSAVTGGL